MTRRRRRHTIALAVCAVAGAAALASGAGAVSGTDIITTVVGTGAPGFSDSAQATSAQLNRPDGLAFDGAGNLYIADRSNARIRKVTPGGTVTTVAGTGVGGFSGDGGPATGAMLNLPSGVAVDGAGNLYIADLFNQRVRKVAPNGLITTVAGTGTFGSKGDNGPATAAQIGDPSGVAVDAAGNLYIADFGNDRIRKVTPTGVITTVAGPGVQRTFSVGLRPSADPTNGSSGVVVDGAGNIYIADLFFHRVRKVTPAGVVTVIAGTGIKGFSGDGGQAASAQLNFPDDVAVDAAGNLYISDSGNARVRRVSPDGIITTVAGTGANGLSGDGGQATSAQLNGPSGLAVDSAGNLYIADQGNHRVRKITAATAAAPTAPAPTGGQTGDAAVEAEVVAASAGRSRLGKRVVRLELSLQENVSATLTLVRRGTTLATKQFASVREGERVLTLRVPAGTASGRATLRFELRDEAGNTVSGQRRVRIGKP